MSEYFYEEMFPLGEDTTPYRKLTDEHVSTVEVDGKTIVKVAPEGLRVLAKEAIREIHHFFRPGHLQQLADILADDEASDNDKYVAKAMLRNACVSAGGVLPSCQDTGTAIIMGKKGQYVWTEGEDGKALSEGVADVYLNTNLRYSQLAPLEMFKEVNTKNNLPAQIDLYATDGDAYKFMFMAKGGGSANKTYLFQQTPATLNEDSMLKLLDEKVKSLGTTACPPYHLAIVIGGTSAETNLKTVKLASARYLDNLPTEGAMSGRAFRDLEMEEKVLEMTRKMGLGAQFGGKYFCHDVRVIRLPRHGASVPVGIGVSCSADRQILAKINKDGIFIEELEHDPAKYMPEVAEEDLSEEVVKVDLNKPMDEIRKQLSQYPIKTRLSLTGPLIVARDLAHAKLRELLAEGQELPQYFKDHIIYYAGPAKTPEGMASGSFGPTTAGRMDAYVDQFQGLGGSMVMLAKGNRSKEVTDACEKHGGFYLGSPGGVAAQLAEESIKKIECIDFEDFGMEAIWRIEVEDFPAFVIVDDKGNDFFQNL